MPKPQSAELKFVVTNTLIVQDIQRSVAADVPGYRRLFDGRRRRRVWVGVGALLIGLRFATSAATAALLPPATYSVFC
jgi:hypothetical protein